MLVIYMVLNYFQMILILIMAHEVSYLDISIPFAENRGSEWRVVLAKVARLGRHPAGATIQM